MEWRFKNENKTIEIGKKFIIAPPWQKTEKVKISLIKGQSFGTGVHETTASCLEILEQLSLSGFSVLDIGIGSGILSIAAKKLGAELIVGFDIEKFAIRECIENCILNNTDNVFCFVSNTPGCIKAEFDLILANIFDDIILNMKHEIERITKEEGYLLLSGVLIEENFRVQREFSKLGFKLIKNIFLEDYTTLLFQKGA